MCPGVSTGGTVVPRPDGTGPRAPGLCSATRAGPRLHAPPGPARAVLLTLRHHAPEAIAAILDYAAHLRATVRDGWPPLLAGKVSRSSSSAPPRARGCRSRAASRGSAAPRWCCRPATCSSAAGETIEDTAKVLGRMVDAIMLRTGPHADPRGARPPRRRPGRQRAHLRAPPLPGARRRADPAASGSGRSPGLRVAYLGDGNNCCVSLMIVGALTGMRVTAGCPPGYRPDPGDRGVGRRRRARARRVGERDGGPPRGGRRGPGALHRHLGVDGRRGARGRADRRPRAVPHRRRADGRRRAGRGGDALPAGAPRPRDHLRGPPRARGRPRGTRRRTACTRRRPCWPTSWADAGRRRSPP